MLEYNLVILVAKLSLLLNLTIELHNFITKASKEFI